MIFDSEFTRPDSTMEESQNLAPYRIWLKVDPIGTPPPPVYVEYESDALPVSLVAGTFSSTGLDPSGAPTME